MATVDPTSFREEKKTSHLSRSPEETFSLGKTLGQALKEPPQVIALFGELGAGKTQFVKGVVAGLEGVIAEEVQSPTFTFLHLYPAKFPIYHFDLYRIRSQKEFLDLGLQEYFYHKGISLIEWPDIIKPILPKNTLEVHFSHKGEETREITWSL